MCGAFETHPLGGNVTNRVKIVRLMGEPSTSYPASNLQVRKAAELMIPKCFSHVRETVIVHNHGANGIRAD